MTRRTTGWLAITLVTLCPLLKADRLLLIQGDPGEESYREGFTRAATVWIELAEQARFEIEYVKSSEVEDASKDRVRNWLAEANKTSGLPLWIVYIGHGSFGPDGAKINLTGPDISEAEMAQWLEPFESPIVFVHGGAASAPFIPALSKEGRVIITATRSGTEQNYARFGEFFALSLLNERSDIDLDGRVSLLEAFVSASSSIETFYLEAGRLTSEHALLDDNGDGLGSPATRFKGLRPIPASNASAPPVDGREAKKISILPAAGERLLTADQIEKRDRLEDELDALYQKKDELSEEAYYEKLETIFVELSAVYLENGPDS